eukprot:COSAG02_NODE_15825_length_1138_cov_1.524543_2_plen_78_part_00
MISLGVDAKLPSPSSPEPGGGSPFGYVVVLLVLGGAMYAARNKALGPCAPKDAPLVSGLGPNGGESTISDLGGDETL